MESKSARVRFIDEPTEEQVQAALAWKTPKFSQIVRRAAEVSAKKYANSETNLNSLPYVGVPHFLAAMIADKQYGEWFCRIAGKSQEELLEALDEMIRGEGGPTFTAIFADEGI